MIKIILPNFKKVFFKIKQRNSTIKKEILGGLSTFLAMIYILSVNPAMLSEVVDPISASNGSEFIGALFLSTALVAGIGTIIMGLVSNVPLALAPGMGINAFFTYTVASIAGFNLGYGGALICVLISTFLYFIIAITPLHQKMNLMLSNNIKIAISAMVGFFLLYLGLINIGIVNSDTPLTSIGKNLANPIVIIGTLSALIGLVLFFCKIKYSIVWTTLIALIMLAIAIPFDPTIKEAFKIQQFDSFSNFNGLTSQFFNSAIWGKTFANPLAYVAIFTFLYLIFFDITGTIMSLGKEGNFFSGNQIQNKKINRKINHGISLGLLTGTLLMNSPTITFIESGTGIKMGARTGLASVCTGILFLLTIALWPIIKPILPIGNFQPAIGHASILIGVLMISTLKDFDWKIFLDWPVLAFTIIFGMLGFSISAGISWGMLTYLLINSFNFLNLKIRQKIKKEKEVGTELRAAIKTLSWLTIFLGLLGLLFIIIDGLTKSGILHS